MPMVRVSVNEKVQKMSKEDLEGQTCGIFVFWLFVEFCVVHTLGGCIRMITDDGPLSPQPCHHASHACHQGAHFTHSVLCSTRRSVDQLRCSPRSDRSCTMYIFFRVKWLSNSHKVHHRATILWLLPALIFEVHRSDSVKFRIENHVNCCILSWPPFCPPSNPPSPPHCHLYFSCHMIFPASTNADSESSLNVSVGASRRQLGR